MGHALFERAPAVPSGVAPEVVGTSHEGRDIECYTFGNGPRHVVVACAIHGNEVGTVKLGRHLLHWLATNENSLGTATYHVIPVLNPDGYALAQKQPDYAGGGRVGRVNAHQVDLNRNFDTPTFKTASVWAHGKDYGETRAVSCGPSPLSEPETQALVRLIEKYHAEVLWSFHNAGADVGGNDTPLSKQLVQRFSDATGFRTLACDDWKRLGQTGTATEWCDIHNVAYLEIEGTTRWGADWKRQSPGILAVVDLLADNGDRHN